MGARFLVWLFAFALAGLAAVAGLNALVDPTSYLTNARLVSWTVCTPGIRADERQSKPVAVRPFAPAALLLGSSQIGIGFDARDPVLRRTLGRTYNFGIAAPTTAEMDSLMRETVPALNVRTIVVGVSFGQMFDAIANRSPRAAGAGVPGFAWAWGLKRSLFSRDALLASLHALASRSRCARPGFRLDGTMPYPTPELSLASREHRTQLAVARSLPDEAERRRTYRLHLADLDDLAAFLCGRGIAVDLALLPNHAWRMEIWSDMAGDARMDRWKRDMTQLAARLRGKGCTMAVWDFSYHNAVTTADFNAPGADAPSFPYWEDSHFRPAVGHRVLQRVLLGIGGDSAGDFGVALTPETVEAQIARAGQARDAWRHSHPAIVAALARLVRDAPE